MSKNHYIIPIFVPNEGCPHTCVFCNQTRITGSKEKIDGPFVRKTIEEYLKTIDRTNSNTVVEVSFFGGTFTAIDINKQKELLAVAKEYKDKGLIDYIRMSTRPDYIDDEILTNLKNYHADIIELGVQSLNDEVLRKSGRGHSKEQVKNASALIKKYGFTLGHQIMPGLPGDDEEKDLETGRMSVSMKPDICRIYPSLVIKDTPMENMLYNGIYTPYTVKQAVSVSKKLYALYTMNDIEVIRIGLQPTEEINYDGSVIAGPFHPAFRELVEGSIYCDMIYHLYTIGGPLECIYINPKDISKLYAEKKFYYKEMLDNMKSSGRIIVNQDNSIERGTIGVRQNGKIITLSQREYFKNLNDAEVKI